MRHFTLIKTSAFVLSMACSHLAFAEDSSRILLAGQTSSAFSQITSGDSGRYREDWQLRDHYSGGLQELTLDSSIGQWKINTELRARNEVDLELSNRFTQEDGRYIIQETTIYPHYYDASNRFYDTAPRRYDLETTLYTLRGEVSVEMGTKSPDSLEQTFWGYRHQSRTGETNSYWGAWLRNASPDDFILFVQPIQRHRNEYSDTFYFGADRALGEWNVGFRQQIERYDGLDKYEEPGYYNDGTAIFTRIYRNQPRHITWVSALNAKRDFLDGRLQLNLGQRYAAIHSDSTTDVDSYTPAGVRHYGEHSLNFLVSDHAGRRYSQKSEVQLDYLPQDHLRFWMGGELLFGKSVGNSTRGEEGAEGSAVDSNDATVDELWAFKSANREVGFTENIGFENTAIPKTRITLEATLDQNRVKYDWDADVTGSRNSGSDGDWSWLSTIWENRNLYSAAIRNWAVRNLTLLARYRYRIDTADVDEREDIANTKTGDPEYTETGTDNYYPGRIGSTKRSTHELLFSTPWKAHPRCTLTPRFQHRNTHYEVSNEPLEEISSFRSNTGSLGLLLQPIAPLTCTVNASRQFALTSTRANSFTNTLNSPNATWYGAITPDFDASYTALDAGVEYLWRELTLFSNGSFVEGNGDFDTALASGSAGVRGPFRKRKDTTWEAAYRYADYHEDENNGINDYTAYAVFFVIRSQFDL